MTDLQTLRRIAEGATPGPWTFYEDTCEQCRRRGNESFNLREVGMSRHGQFDRREDIMHVSTFNPSLVLKLLRVVECAEEFRKLQHQEIGSFTPDELCDRADALDTALADLQESTTNEATDQVNKT